MKKTSNTTKAPAPASKSTRSKSTTPTAKVASTAKKSAAAPASTAAAAKPVAAKSPAADPAMTKIRATIDVGFGNSLFIRGEGAGLSWSQGRLMQCAGAEEWLIELPASGGPVIFKFLRNDEAWSVGDDYRAAAGEDTSFAPFF